MFEQTLTPTEFPTVLVVGDRPENLEAVESVLDELKINIVKADSGEAALRAVLKRDFAVILLDVQMPKMDGFEAATLIRARDRSAHTPIIFLTAIERSEERAFQGYQSGAVDYIFKPFNPQILRAKVTVFADLWSLRAALTNSEASLRHINATLEDMVTQRTHEVVKSEAKYRQLVENIREIFLMGKVEQDFTQGALTFISPQVETILGIPPDDFLKNPGMWSRLVHPEDSTVFASSTRQALSAGQPVTRAYRQKNTITGEYCWLEDTLLPQFDEHGRVVGYYGVAHDTTERKQMEQFIQILNKVSRKMELSISRDEIFNALQQEFKKAGRSCMIYLVDEIADVLYMKYFSFQPSVIKAIGTMIGKPIQEYKIPVDSTDMSRRIVRGQETCFNPDPAAEITRLLPAGLKKFADAIAKLINIPKIISAPMIIDGRVIAVFALLSKTLAEEDVPAVTAFANQLAATWHKAQLYDLAQNEIAERKQAEAELRESEEQFRNAMDYAAIGMALVALDGGWLYVNPAVCNIVGYSEKELLTKTFQDITHPDDLNSDLRNVRQLLAGEIKTYQMEKRYFHKTGRIVWVLLSVSLVRGGDGKPLHFISQIQDITERKQAEERLIIANEEKEKRAAELVIANKELVFQNEEKEKRAAELVIANKELVFQNEEKEKRAAELTLVQMETLRRLQNIQSLRAIDEAINGSLDLHLTLSVALKQVISELKVDAAAVLLLNPHTQILEYANGLGFRGKGIERSRLHLGGGHAGRAALEKKIIYRENLREGESEFIRAPLLRDEEFVAYFAAPLIAKGKVSGVLEVYLRSEHITDDEWINFFETLAGQVAIAVDNANLFTDLQHSNRELFNAYDATIEGWSHALDLRDKETENHTLRVTEMTLNLARAAGITENELVHVRRGALLHDIGKMGVPDGILLKPGKLTDEEWVAMRKHPTFAFELLSPIAYLRPAIDIPYSHHEKWDGSGYPRGLKGEQIPLAARLFAIVDVWDALTSDRPYRAAWSKEKTREHIQSLSGTHFDPKVVELFLRLQI